MGILTVVVYRYDTGARIPNAGVYLFAGAGGIEPPENATMSEITDALGEAKFTVTGSWRVGVAAQGYKAQDPYQLPSEQWWDTYSAWGATGVTDDDQYLFPMEAVDIDLTLVGKIGTVLSSIGFFGIIFDSARRRLGRR